MLYVFTHVKESVLFNVLFGTISRCEDVYSDDSLYNVLGFFLDSFLTPGTSDLVWVLNLVAFSHFGIPLRASALLGFPH